MTLEELKLEADKLGYKVIKKPNYNCHCYVPYPNEYCKLPNGKWKCVDKYIPIQSGHYGEFKMTKCIRKDFRN